MNEKIFGKRIGGGKIDYGYIGDNNGLTENLIIGGYFHPVTEKLKYACGITLIVLGVAIVSKVAFKSGADTYADKELEILEKLDLINLH